MATIHVRAVVRPDGSLHLADLPFPPGEEVEVTVRTQDRSSQSFARSPLQGTVLKYVDPTDPVAEVAEKGAGTFGGRFMRKLESVAPTPILEVSSDQELIIPASVLAKMGIQPGQKFMPVGFQGIIRLMPLVSHEDAHGSMPGLDTTIEDEDDEKGM